MAGGVALLRWLARLLLPGAFLGRFGAEMEAVWWERLGDARRTGGRGRCAVAWWREAGDVVAAAWSVRVSGTVRRPGADRGDRRERAMREWTDDLRVAARSLARRPGFTAVAAATLALGVGGATGMLALVESVLLRPLGYAEPDRVVQLFLTNPELGWDRGPVSFPNFDDWRRGADPFESLSAYQPGLRSTLIRDGEAREVQGTRVTGEVFRTLGIAPLHGRALTPVDEGSDAEPVVVLSHGLWTEAFGADPAVVGSTVELGAERLRVVAVLPSDVPPLWGPERYWTTFRDDPESFERDMSFLAVVGRLRPGVDVAMAQERLEALVRGIERTDPGGNEGRSARVERRLDVVAGSARRPLWILMGAVALLLAIAAANLAGLMLVRGAARRGEVAVRAALGAGRHRLVRALFAESAVIAFLGLVASVPVARGLVGAVLAVGPAALPRRAEIALEAPALLGGLGLGVLATLAFGLLPAMREAHTGASADVAGRLRVARGGGVAGLQRVLVVGQVALSVVLLTGAGLLGSSLLRLARVDAGFDPTGVLTFRVGAPAGMAPDEADAFFDRVQDEVGALPGVESVGATWALPLGQSFASSEYMVEGRPDDETWLLSLVPVRGDYFRAMGIRLVAGRVFDGSENVDRPPVIVSRSLARRVWGGDAPIGRRLRKGNGEDARTFEVVGVVDDVASQTLGAEPSLQTFWPQEAAPWASELHFTVRTSGDPAGLTPAVRAAVARVDDRVPVADVMTMAARVADELAPFRFRLLLVGAFAGVAVLLCALGIYGLTAFLVARRTHEIGVRMALGARRARVVLGILGQGVGLTLVGGLLGAGVAALLSGTISDLLYGVRPLAAAVYVSAIVALTAAATLAAWLPARRASGVDPARALRAE